MDCQEFIKKYQLYLDQELSKQQYKSFEKHIRRCSQCGRRIQFEMRFKMTIVKKFEGREAPKELQRKIRTKLF